MDECGLEAVSRKNLRRAGIAAFVLLLVILLGPHCIHLLYRLATPTAVILSNRMEYNILAGEESGLDPEAQKVSIQKRYALFLWFHARGLGIDEDDERHSIWHPWIELMEHWQFWEPTSLLKPATSPTSRPRSR